MALAKPNPTVVDTAATTNIPIVEPVPYQGIVTDTKYTPNSSLLVFVEGAIWDCNYFSQVTNANSDLRVADQVQSGVYQQYTKIEKMEIKVETPLTASQADDTKLTTVVGEGMVYPFFVPNAGDMFIADVGDGNSALFQVLNSERKSFMKDSVFNIEYSLVDYVKNIQTRVADLESKVIKTVYFEKDFALKGENPFLTSLEQTQYTDINLLYDRIVDFFFDQFFNYEFNTIVLPKQDFYVYDHYIVDFIMKMVNTNDHMNIRLVRRLNVDDDCALKKPTLLSAMIRWDKNLLRIAKTQMGIAFTSTFSRNPMLEGIAFSGIPYVVYPVMEQTFNPDDPLATPAWYSGYTGIDYDYAALNQNGLSGNCIGRPLTETETVKNIPQTIYTAINVADKSVPLVKPVLGDSYYILSGSFYGNGDDMSILEALVKQYFDMESLNKTNLLAVCNDFYNWSQLDQFYYLPILILLLKYSIKR